MHLSAAKMHFMSAVRGRTTRRTRGSATRLLQGRVDPQTHAAASAAADELGISLAAYLEALVLADQAENFVRPGPDHSPRQEAIAI